jgi:hypothetical protein
MRDATTNETSPHRRCNRQSIAIAIAIAVSAGGTGSGCSAPLLDTGTDREAIVNGVALSQGELTHYGLVAIYHPDDPGKQQFFPRPCSGTIIASASGRSTVLTARHCVTTDGTVNGPIAPVSAFRLIASLTPGPANPNPPAGTVIPTDVTAQPITLGAPSDASQDLAVLHVNVDWSANVAARLGMWVGGATGSYSGVDVSLGYGINVVDSSCSTDRSIVGAGVARRGGVFTRVTTVIDQVSGSWQSVNAQPNGIGQAIACGDSGGPDFVDMQFDDNASMEVLVGVHSRGDQTMSRSAGPSAWLQSALGGLALGPLGTTARLSRPLNSHTVSLTSSSTTFWLYNWNTHQIFDPSQEDVDQDWCLDLSGTTLTANLCSAAATQKWFIDPTLRVRNSSTTGKCLTAPASGSTVSVANCVDLPNRQGWYFRAQP